MSRRSFRNRSPLLSCGRWWWYYYCYCLDRLVALRFFRSWNGKPISRSTSLHWEWNQSLPLLLAVFWCVIHTAKSLSTWFAVCQHHLSLVLCLSTSRPPPSLSLNLFTAQNMACHSCSHLSHTKPMEFNSLLGVDPICPCASFDRSSTLPSPSVLVCHLPTPPLAFLLPFHISATSPSFSFELLQSVEHGMPLVFPPIPHEANRVQLSPLVR